jgi:hypothetical protein
MRLVKLSTAEFDDMDRVDEFFEGDLPQRRPPGQFLITPGWIAEDALDECEVLLFSFLGRVVWVARAGSGRLQNTGRNRGRYPNYFIVDLRTAQKVDFSVSDLEDAMHRRCGVTKSIAVSRGWVRLPNTVAATRLVQTLGKLSYPV